MDHKHPALVGYTGFVGGNLLQQARFDCLYNSQNIQDIRGQSFSHMIVSAAQAKKWWANQNPQEDWEGIERLLENLSNCRADRVTLISTIDVLGSAAGLTERDTPDMDALTAYGLHRWRLEETVQARFEQVLVVRLPGLFGHGLKKNVIYDLLHDNALGQIQPQSSYQYYDLSCLWRDIGTAWAHQLARIHLFPEPVQTAELLQAFFPGRDVGRYAGPEAHYDHRTIHGTLFGGDDRYIASKSEVMRQLGAFIQDERRRAS
jgi:hypothetical protein